MATRNRHSPEQIARKLMAADRLLAEGKDTAAVCRELGVSEATYHRLGFGCYDYVSHILFAWHAPELWRRFTNNRLHGLSAYPAAERSCRFSPPQPT